MPNGTNGTSAGSNVIDGCALYVVWGANVLPQYFEQCDIEAHDILNAIKCANFKIDDVLEERIENYLEIRTELENRR